MTGLARICRLYGSIEVKKDGDTVVWEWDYAREKPVLKKEMTKEQFQESEKCKWEKLKNNIQNEQ